MPGDPQFYRASFGDLRLWISQISTDKSRRQVVHELSDGDLNVVEDKGRKPVISRVALLFDRMLGDSMAPLERLRKFAEAVDDKPRIFSHPIEGSYLARVSEFSHELDEHSNITGSCTITQVGESLAVIPAGAGTIPASGAGAVSSAASALDLELVEIGVVSTLPFDCISAVDGWAAIEDLNPREVLALTGSLTSALGQLAATLQADLAMWAAFKATIVLANAMAEAALAATADTAQTFTIRIGAPIALRTLVAMTYGADEAAVRYFQVVELNDIANPASLDIGSELVMPSPTPKSRRA